MNPFINNFLIHISSITIDSKTRREVFELFDCRQLKFFMMAQLGLQMVDQRWLLSRVVLLLWVEFYLNLF